MPPHLILLHYYLLTLCKIKLKTKYPINKMKANSGPLYALGWMMGVVFGSMLAAASRMISDPVFGLIGMILLVTWWRYVQML